MLQPASARHGVAPVDHEVDDDLFEKSRIDPGETGFAVEVHDQLDVVPDDRESMPSRPRTSSLTSTTSGLIT